MGKRTNTARWTGKMWRIDVQQDGKRKSFYSSRPGRTGQAVDPPPEWAEERSLIL